jgi:hypothetical protein
LHDAAHWNQKEAAEFLLANRAEVNAQDEHGFAPLHCAVAQGFKDLAEVLIANQAEINLRDNEGATPLHFAAESDRRDIVELLLWNCSSPKRPRSTRRTTTGKMLQLAMDKGHREVAELLRSQGEPR